MSNLIYFCIVAGIFVLDRGSKFLISSVHRTGARFFFRKGFFSLRYVKNTGGAFGLFPRKSHVFLIVTLVAVALLVYLLFFSDVRYDLAKIGLALLLGGSLGNLVDRLISGGVVDFIQFGRAPVFNLADVAIVCGSGLIVFVLAGGPKLVGS
ncbi:MAG: signal peptidase II [Candidatus Acetothermia bacterium]